MAKAIKNFEVNSKVTASKRLSKSHSSVTKVAVKDGQQESGNTVKTGPKVPRASGPNQVELDKGQSPVQVNQSLFSMKNFHAERDLPIVYSPNYNMSVVGLELMHHFDTKKYSKIADYLSSDFMDTQWARPRQPNEPPDKEEEDNQQLPIRRLRYLAPNRPVSKQELEYHHRRDYVNLIHGTRSTVARITETWALNLLPLFVIESRLLTPIKWQIAGTIFACHLAMQHGWAINLGGGFHQASHDNGETFCIFSDIMLAMKYIWRKHPLQKFMIIDLDAHQATGLERDLLAMEERHRKKVHLVDVYNTTIQPPNERAAGAIDSKVELGRFTGDKTYLTYLEQTLTEAFGKFKPTMIIYVAGQDVLKNDQLGLLNVSEEALLRRDEMVFGWATQNLRCPIVMLLGGGYLPLGAKVQADSIKNLFTKGLIWGGHRSGSRSLSRPRPQQTTKTTNLGSSSASKTTPFIPQLTKKT